MRLYLVVTAAEPAVEDGTLDRFLSSVGGHPRTHVVCVARGWSRGAVASMRGAYADAITVIKAPRILSLSAARNLALRHLIGQSPGRSSAVGFPDDDCWYLEGTLEAVEAAFRDRTDAAAISGCYGPSASDLDRVRFPDVAEDMKLKTALNRISSVTMFVRWDYLLKVGGFNEALGAGTPALAGEDTDFGIRLFATGGAVLYRPDVIVGHLYGADPSKSYAGPYVLVLISHLRHSPRLLPLVFHGLAGSLRRRPVGGGPFYALQFIRPARVREVLAGRKSTRLVQATRARD